MADYQSRKKPVMAEFHLPGIQFREENYKNPGYQPFSKKDNVDDIIDGCLKNFSKFKNTLTNTSSTKILDAAEAALNHPKKTNFSSEEKNELLEIISRKKKH